jgi:hypothetical protein
VPYARTSLSSLEQVFTSSLPPLTMLKDLYIRESPLRLRRWQDDIENTLWLDLLRSFLAVKNLYLSKKFVPRTAPALQELVGGRTTDVLPTCRIFSWRVFGRRHASMRAGKSSLPHEGSLALTSHPVAVSRWDGDI